MGRRVFDASFKRMAIDLSYARGSVKEVADELGIDPGRLSKWRKRPTWRPGRWRWETGPYSTPFCSTLTGACSTPAALSESSWKECRWCRV
ncbi:hypothetical protein DXT99_23970 [Pontibacter diazotrophicus]|uniref:Transposase n=1 Tax=Pontibacter diazotrophicus TaxID=1400979 RepID=A0A3D8L3E8_9BACT|nr:hypothetical protein DXT99_23970 [Pontibacter diazotrophicus]